MGISDGLPASRIVGGESAPVGKYPYQVQLRYRGRFLCGGSIINKQYILTAAHCIYRRDSSDFVVIAGTNFLNETGDEYDVADLKYHEDYDRSKRIHDIGLMRLTKDIEFKRGVQEVPLADGSEYDRDNEFPVILTGWGRLRRSGKIPNELQEIKLVTTTLSRCQSSHRNIRTSHICTYTKVGEGACNGDSGGPLVTNFGEQVGIVSYGYPCGVGSPDVYTRVSYYYDWIKANAF
ncbi:chymotrypsin-2-like [Prorops nasuta]|uniref:chymotrypsin-2-like n=1 Tax=Prorops nasuta TaxID=863751 RepID=UPI0034CEDAFA